jgi:dTDP-4-dehydrorhamnose reductase
VKVAILGNGWIGKRLQEHLGGEILPGKVLSMAGLERLVSEVKPDVLINAATHNEGYNVDACEINKDRVLFTNSYLPLICAEVALRNKIKLVHISSGCIYDGNCVPLVEEEPPNFFDLFYSRSKIYSESALMPLAEKFGFLILRPRIPLDNRPHQRNILTKLIGYKKVINEANSVTYLPDFLYATEALLREDAWGVFNVVNDGVLLYPDLMDAYKRYRPDFNYEITTLKDLELTRTNVILNTSKLAKYWTSRNINWILDDCVREYIANG